jgi:Uma2 family endonuclease
MSAHPDQKITPEEYLKLERAAEFKSEYYGGYMYAMAGTSFEHSTIAGNLVYELMMPMRKRGCAVGPSDLRIRVSPEGLYTYPDVYVICGQPEFTDAKVDTLINPTVIIEVLSPSTEAYDRGLKWLQYRTIESLQEYVLVSQGEARVEVFRRQPEGKWILSDFAGPDAVCKLETVDCGIPLSAIYHGVTFKESPPRIQPMLL